MKNIKSIKNFLFLPVIAAIALTIGSCTENIDESARYTNKENTVILYLEQFPEYYSQYLDLLKKIEISEGNSTVYQLLTARGNYTVFAPTNEAIDIYLQSLAKENVIEHDSTQVTWDDPALDKVISIKGGKEITIRDSVEKVIVFNSILDGGDENEAYQTSDFIEADNSELQVPNLNDRKVKVSRDGTQFIIGDSSRIDTKNCDILTLNGRIHVVDRVVALSTKSIAQTFLQIRREQTSGWSVLATMIDTCGLMGKLSEKEDETYYDMVRKNQITLIQFKSDKSKIPARRRIGYTIFAEPDAMWENLLGISNISKANPSEVISSLIQYIKDNNLVPTTGPNKAVFDTNFKNENNALNMFVTYHILPMRIGSKDRLVIHHNELWHTWKIGQGGIGNGTQAIVYEYYTTMGKPRLMKIMESVESQTPQGGIFINRFPVLNNGRHDVYNEKYCDPEKQGILIRTDSLCDLTAENAAIYKIEQPLRYNDDVIDNLAKERIRYEITTIFPEMMTNDIRLDESDSYYATFFPTQKTYQYLENAIIEEGTEFYYLNGMGCNWKNYEGDELNIRGSYDFTLKLPPVPKDGHYELRVATQSNSSVRGMCQVYFGTNPNSLPAAGIPLDMRLGAKVRATAAGNLPSPLNWVEDDKEDDEVNADNDKKLRNNEYMKGPKHYYWFGGTETARDSQHNLRRIIVSQDLKANETYYIRFKTVLDDNTREFYMDYLEWCPKEIYDNPSTPEDIW